MDAPPHDILEEFSTKHYHIIYRGFYSNHVSHGIVALYKLGASRNRIVQFADHYKRKLERSDQYQDEALPELVTLVDSGKELDQTQEIWTQLKGTRKCYHRLVRYYEDLLAEKYGGSIQQLVEKEWGNVALGLIGAAFHGLIHLGYGCDVMNARSVCEGMAKAHYCYFPLHLSSTGPALDGLGSGDKDIIEVLACVSEDVDLWKFMLCEAMTAEWAKAKDIGMFQAKVGVLFASKGDTLARYVKQLHFPYSIENLNSGTVSLLASWLVECTVSVYVMSGKSDFFLIHGVTSAWSLKQVLGLLNDKSLILSTIHVYLCALIATYVAQGCPALTKASLASSKTKSLPWGSIKKLVLQGGERDEHVYKLVQVCHDMSRESGGDPDRDNLYRTAATMALRMPLLFGIEVLFYLLAFLFISVLL